ncbi:thioredoxin family protein [Trinickia fusca]|uniref:Thioredoxin family protein n=1 Tax=Trinickia fusca TaxID=2419777 RepID=A0A494X1Z2_9BURK|nr:thioredoxin fold domain-containing protein [Trinickia fusca]RKP44340.1 thioredoxin family protein [Trinickia fusca]
MNSRLVGMIGALALTASVWASPAPPAPAHALPPGIAWQQGDVDAAFALAKTQHKPLFLYWGAVWCPPCNQVKATIFNQQAFKERASFFIPVYLDGDSESAQKLSERFKVRGYPTMILFSPDGTEITRLPGEVDAARYLQALSLGMNAAHPVKQTLAAALKDGAHLGHDEWRMLADYAWDPAEPQPVANEKVARTLQTLARHARADHADDEALRFELKAVAAAATEPRSEPIDKAAATQAVEAVLADRGRARANFDVLVAYANDIVRYLSAADTPERRRLVDASDSALTALAADATLSTTDRLSALHGRVTLARLDAPKGAPLPPALLNAVREQATVANTVTTNGYERLAVVDAAADALTAAGLINDSDRMLHAELTRSVTPYYVMSELGANAKARGDSDSALDWYKRAYDASVGPATRLRWSVSYFSNVVELAPQDEARVQQAASAVLTEVSATHDAFYGRNRANIERLVTRLSDWNRGKQHDAAVKHVLAQLDGVCAKLPADDPQRATCHTLAKPTSA